MTIPIAPATTILLCIDLQNGIVNSTDRSTPNLTDNVTQILTLCRQQQYNIIHVQHRSDNVNDSLHPSRTDTYSIHTCAAPLTGETLLVKHTSDAFGSTTLDKLLKSHKTKQLILIGMSTTGCVQSTCRRACDLEYQCIVISDATACPSFNYFDDESEIINPDQAQRIGLSMLGPLDFATIMSTQQLLNGIKATSVPKHTYTLQPQSNNVLSAATQVNQPHNSNSSIPSQLGADPETTAKLAQIPTYVKTYDTASEFLNSADALCAHHPLCCTELDKCQQSRYTGNYDQRPAHNVSIRKHAYCENNVLCLYAHSEDTEWTELRNKYNAIHERHKINDSAARRKRRASMKQQQQQAQQHGTLTLNPVNAAVTATNNTSLINDLPQLPALPSGMVSKDESTATENGNQRKSKRNA